MDTSHGGAGTAAVTAGAGGRPSWPQTEALAKLGAGRRVPGARYPKSSSWGGLQALESCWTLDLKILSCLTKLWGGLNEMMLMDGPARSLGPWTWELPVLMVETTALILARIQQVSSFL